MADAREAYEAAKKEDPDGERTKELEAKVAACAAKTGAVVCAEEHQIYGGAGSAVAEVVAETVPCPVIRVGVEDTFGKSGPALELLEIYGLNAENICNKAKQAIANK